MSLESNDSNNFIKYEDLTEYYRSANPSPAVPLATFLARVKRYNLRGKIEDGNLHDALYLTVEEYKLKYGVRKTWVKVDGEQIDLEGFYNKESARAKVTYRAFWQRLKPFRKNENLDREVLEDALTLTREDWVPKYGGGRHRAFIYTGELYPDYFGVKFHSVSAFLKTIGRYNDKAMVWSRLKAGWDLDTSLFIPKDSKTK